MISDSEKRKTLSLIIAASIKQLYGFSGDLGDLVDRVEDELIVFGLPGYERKPPMASMTQENKNHEQT